MLSVIKTAIITIIISFISGVLLDNYKNLAPKISCTMGKCVPIKMNNKKIRAYILKVKNISNKTLHDLTVNVQGHHNDLKMDDAQITGGLKFDICGEYNNFNVSIPFLSKNDEFSVKVFVDDVQGEHSKPVITLRSPENFKKIGHGEGNGLFPVLSDTSQKICNLF
ncbi:Membrane protein, partial [human gut metagenome]